MHILKHYTVNSISWAFTASAVMLLTLCAMVLSGWVGFSLLVYLIQS